MWVGGDGGKKHQMYLVFITTIMFSPSKAFNSNLSSHADLGAWIEWDSGGGLESWIYRLKTHPNVLVSQSLWRLRLLPHSLSLSLRLLNGPVRRWHEVDHPQPPVDSKRRLVMMPSMLHPVGGVTSCVQSRNVKTDYIISHHCVACSSKSQCRYRGLRLPRHADWFTVSVELDLPVCQD